MSGEVREQAWQAFCTRLETLGIDPYSPNLPPDDRRHAELQAAVSEYEIAIGKVIPVPPGWEGHPPDRPIQSLVGLIEWLEEEWGIVLAYEMGGGQVHTGLLDRSARTVRNAFRMLDWLGVEDRPGRPVPPETVAEAKKQIDELELWVRQRNKEGFQPSRRSESEPATPHPDSSSAPADPNLPSVVLNGPGRPPTVLGREKAVLTPARYNVVQALLKAGMDGLSKDELDAKSGHPEARKILKNLAKSDPDWAKVISFAESTGVGYRLL